MRAASLLLSLSRTRRWLRCEGLDADYAMPVADLGVRLRNRRGIRLGDSVTLLRGAELNAVGGTISIGRQSAVCRWAVIQSLGGSVTIGARSLIGDFCNLYGQGHLEIGDDVMLASGVRVLTAEHEVDQPGPVGHSPERVARTAVCNGAWIGANAVILAGVTIGEGAVVAAGAVVRGDVGPEEIVGGVPARLIRRRRTGTDPKQ